MILKYFLVSAFLLLGVYGVDTGTLIEKLDDNECRYVIKNHRIPYPQTWRQLYKIK